MPQTHKKPPPGITRGAVHIEILFRIETDLRSPVLMADNTRSNLTIRLGRLEGFRTAMRFLIAPAANCASGHFNFRTVSHLILHSVGEIAIFMIPDIRAASRRAS